MVWDGSTCLVYSKHRFTSPVECSNRPVSEVSTPTHCRNILSLTYLITFCMGNGKFFQISQVLKNQWKLKVSKLSGAVTWLVCLLGLSLWRTSFKIRLTGIVHGPCVLTGNKPSTWVTVYWNVWKNSRQSIVAVVEVDVLSLGKRPMLSHIPVCLDLASLESLKSDCSHPILLAEMF